MVFVRDPVGGKPVFIFEQVSVKYVLFVHLGPAPDKDCVGVVALEEMGPLFPTRQQSSFCAECIYETASNVQVDLHIDWILNSLRSSYYRFTVPFRFNILFC